MGKWLKRSGIAAAVLVGVAVLAAGAVYAASEMRLRRTWQVPGQALAQRTDPAALARGKHVATAIGKCMDCHGADLGGKVFIDDPAMGQVIAPNLTAGDGGIGKRYTDADLERAVRHGIAPEGRGLLVMPSDEYYHLSDEDAASLFAYLRSLPPVDRTLPPSRLGPLGRGLYLSGKLPLFAAERIAHQAPRPAPVSPGVTREYGEYLATVGGCRGCHGKDLVGGPIPGTPPEWPPASNLTPAGIGAWTEADFFKSLRSGIRPDGTAINGVMPWALAGQMSDDEIRAVWLYLRSVPAKQTPAAE